MSTLTSGPIAPTERGQLPAIDSVALFPVVTPRVYGEPSQHVMLRLTAADGTEGWGEMSDVSHLPAMMPDTDDLQRCLESLLIGISAGQLASADALMDANFPGSRFHGKACLVRSAVSIAMHDLKARLLGISVCELMGGARRDRIPICYPIFRMKSIRDVGDRKELVTRQYQKGFRAFRFYFGFDTDADESLLDWIESTFSREITITSLDGSGLFTLPAFLRAYERLSKYRFESIESPVDRDHVELIAEARRRIAHPVSEHVRSPEYAIRLIRQHAVDIFNVSITVAGGLRGMMTLFDLAHSAGLECLIGTTQELSVATAAQAHAGAVAPTLDYASDPVGPEIYEHDVTRERARFEDGCLIVPSGPGLGVEVDLEKVMSMKTCLTSLNDVKSSFSRG